MLSKKLEGPAGQQRRRGHLRAQAPEEHMQGVRETLCSDALCVANVLLMGDALLRRFAPLPLRFYCLAVLAPVRILMYRRTDKELRTNQIHGRTGMCVSTVCWLCLAWTDCATPHAQQLRGDNWELQQVTFGFTPTAGYSPRTPPMPRVYSISFSKAAPKGSQSATSRDQ